MDYESRRLERLATRLMDPYTYLHYLHRIRRQDPELFRHLEHLGYSSERIQRLGRLLEIRRLQRLHRGNGPIRAMLRELWNIRRMGFGGAAPPQFNDLSRVQFRGMAASLARRHSATRIELARFIRSARQHPGVAMRVRHLVASGAASGSLAFVGGQVSGRTALLRAVFGAAGRTAGAFVLSPQGLIVVAALSIVVGLAIYHSSGERSIGGQAVPRAAGAGSAVSRGPMDAPSRELTNVADAAWVGLWQTSLGTIRISPFDGALRVEEWESYGSGNEIALTLITSQRLEGRYTVPIVNLCGAFAWTLVDPLRFEGWRSERHCHGGEPSGSDRRWSGAKITRPAP